ncbi:CdaR family transcriptional regulator [Conservatibacter flavescens]|uniref:XRE family transcriptional regulator n=1 Tax=Conservatibacter flavescens TaxID=28161 RepID=A0A2M8S3G6_9PAST|nr:sugar diacid recognition domain-containing protein [Conservatibacter flavescens]PJG85666.1 hypothetical protein CVP05_04745 [Conservatibacter flavescens]
MKLNQQTATAIVKRAMRIIPYSVNVMDENAMIIASGDASRIGERHTGAVIVLRRQEALEIDEELAKQWNYEAREGINLPINYLGRTIGVIGISGNPDQVRHYAQLVTMTAELMIEHRAMLEQERWQRRYKEEFVHQLLRGNLSVEQISSQAEFFQFDFEQPFVVLIFALQQPTSERLQALLLHLEQRQQNLALAVVDLDKIGVLLSVNELDYLRKTERLRDFLPKDWLKNTVKIAVGAEVNSLQEAHFSYQSALHTLIYAMQSHRKKSILFFEDYLLPALLTDFAQSWQGKKLLTAVQKIQEHQDRAQLFKSLQQYFFSNCDLSHASQKLFIHPNTLRYRLTKIEQITGLSFNKIDEKFRLYLGTLLLPYLEKNTK